MLTTEEEKALVEACKTDPARFEKVYDEYYAPIFGYIYRRIGGYDDAKDITSEVFLRAYTSISRFTWKEISLSSWIYRIATNEVNSFFRRKRRPLLQFLDIREHFMAEYPDPASLEAEKQDLERQIAENHLFLHVQQIVSVMAPKYQTAVSLRYFEGKSIKEIAEIVNKKEGTVKSLLSRGIGKIRRSLDMPHSSHSR